jgi:hypothetical protein
MAAKKNASGGKGGAKQINNASKKTAASGKGSKTPPPTKKLGKQR